MRAPVWAPGRIKAIQLDYSDALQHLQQAVRKAPPPPAAPGFQQAVRHARRPWGVCTEGTAAHTRFPMFTGTQAHGDCAAAAGRDPRARPLPPACPAPPPAALPAPRPEYACCGGEGGQPAAVTPTDPRAGVGRQACGSATCGSSKRWQVHTVPSSSLTAPTHSSSGTVPWPA
jgi:hypothetical protein